MMNSKHLLVSSLGLLLAPQAAAFVVPAKPLAVHNQQSFLGMSAVGGDEDKFGNFKKDLSDLSSGFDVDKLKSKMPPLDADMFQSNLMSGELGERGEIYAAIQFALLLFIVVGGIPFIGSAMMFLLGPGLMLAGGGVFAVSLKDLGSNLSPWVVPPEDGSLVTDGIYAKMRHGQYSGILAMLAGLSITTESANRLLLTAILFYVLDVMTEYEEQELVKKFPGEYEAYRGAVRGKFFPEEIEKQFPWNKMN